MRRAPLRPSDVNRRPALLCGTCGLRLPRASARLECSCGGLLEARLSASVRGRRLRLLLDRRLARDPAGQGSGVWRFRELLLSGRGTLVSHPEGNTTLYRRDAVSRWAGVADLALKHEGENPTGSFKDRGMTVAVTQAVRSGAQVLACASTGNTSAS